MQQNIRHNHTGAIRYKKRKKRRNYFIVLIIGLGAVTYITVFAMRSPTRTIAKVEVSNTLSKETTILKPGQNISFDNEEKPHIKEVNTAVYTAWTEGLFYFEDKPLKDIMSTLGRWYNVNIFFENENLYDIKFNFWLCAA